MKVTQTVTALMLLTVVVLPTVSLASTYQYVDNAGKIQSVEANSSSQALAIAPNIAPHSGVILGKIANTGTTYDPGTTTNTSGSFYQYVDVNGNVQSVNAPNASTALATAPNISPHSGVILVTSNTKITN